MDNSNDKILNGNEKKGNIWIIAAFLILIISVSGVLITNLVPALNTKKFANDILSLQYTNSWAVDKNSPDKLILYYLSEKNNVIVNKIKDFTSIQYPLNSSIEEKGLYQSFLTSFKNQNKYQILNGTDKFLKIDEGIYYARFDYIKEENSKYKRSYYILVNKNYDKIVTMISKCDNKRFASFDKKIKEIFKSIKFDESSNQEYSQFIANNSNKYTTYNLAYLIPDCWKLYSNNTYNNIFVFNDQQSIMEIKVISNPEGKDPTNSIRETVSNKYIGIESEESKIIGSNEWTKIKSYDYLSQNGKTLHNEVYYTTSKDRKHIYCINIALSNKTTPKKTKYLNETIKYVLESAKIN